MKRSLAIFAVLLAACGGSSSTGPAADEALQESVGAAESAVDEGVETAPSATEDAMPPWAPGMYDPAVIHWEIMSHDAAALSTFYSDVFGWESMTWGGDGSGPGELEYHMMLSRGESYGIMGGIGQIPPADETGEEIPPYLTFYVDVADVDALAERVVELGGAVVHGPFEIPEVGRVVMFTDPGDNLFAMMRGAESEDHGEEAWPVTDNPVVHWEIVSEPAAPVRAFYSDLFGWSFDVSDEVDYAEVSCTHPYGVSGGIGGTDEGNWPEAVSFYVGVPDLDEYLDLAVDHGGLMMVAPTLVIEGVEIAAFQDPDGHLVGLFRMPDEAAIDGAE